MPSPGPKKQARVQLKKLAGSDSDDEPEIVKSGSDLDNSEVVAPRKKPNGRNVGECHETSIIICITNLVLAFLP